MSKLPFTLINGQPISTVTVNNRGLAYGDGVFETMLVVDGEVPLWRFHHERLLKGVVALALNLENQRLRQMLDETLSVAKDLDVEFAVLKLIVTRAATGRGYQSDNTQPADIIFQLSHYQPVVENLQGVNVKMCQQRLNPVSWAGLKTLNQLPYVLAAQEFDINDYQEGLLLNSRNELIEATARNVFIVKEETLYTPILNECGVAGVMRQCVIETLAPQLQLEVKEAVITEVDLESADEVFLTNSVTGIWPVIECNQWQWSVGPITRSLQSFCHGLYHY